MICGCGKEIKGKWICQQCSKNKSPMDLIKMIGAKQMEISVEELERGMNNK